MNHDLIGDEMIEGYRDGCYSDEIDYPARLGNRSPAYKHGWLNGRDDRILKPRASAAQLRIAAEIARAQSGWMQ